MGPDGPPPGCPGPRHWGGGADRWKRSFGGAGGSSAPQPAAQKPTKMRATTPERRRSTISL
jgi:hypothetical protein